MDAAPKKIELLSAPKILQLLTTLHIMPFMEPSLQPITTPPFTDSTLFSIQEYITLRIQRAISKINSIIITDDPDDYNSLPKTIDSILNYLDLDMAILLKNDLKSRNEKRRFNTFIKIRIARSREAFVDIQKHLASHKIQNFPELEEAFIHAMKNISHIINLNDSLIGNYS